MNKKAVVLGLFVAAIAASGQTVSGSITGSILDPQSAVVANAKVSIREAQQQFVVNTVSDSSGRFVVLDLAPGTYSLSLEAAGFKRLERSNIVLNANDKLTLGDIRLEVGAVTESVQVSTEAVTLQTESAERGAALVGTQMENIAVNGRSYLALAGLAPGVVSTVSLATAGPGGLANISANGTRLNSNQLTITASATWIPVPTAA